MTYHYTSKRPWGTITKPDNMHLGYQRMTSYEVEQTTNRLYYVPRRREPRYRRPNPKMSAIDIEKMVERLTKGGGEKASDSRRVAEGPLKKIGILNSFVWKGYN